MDEELQRLKREADENPADEAAARRYESALVRAGRTAQVEERFGFKFLCDQDWWAMTPDPGSTLVRTCAECTRKVIFVSSVAMLRDAVANGQCVAIDSRFYRDGAIQGMAKDDRFHGAADPAAPCVVELVPPVPPPPRPLAGAPVPLPPRS